jgi:hypothetical protein
VAVNEALAAEVNGLVGSCSEVRGGSGDGCDNRDGGIDGCASDKICGNRIGNDMFTCREASQLDTEVLLLCS